MTGWCSMDRNRNSGFCNFHTSFCKQNLVHNSGITDFKIDGCVGGGKVECRAQNL